MKSAIGTATRSSRVIDMHHSITVLIADIISYLFKFVSVLWIRSQQAYLRAGQLVNRIMISISKSSFILQQDIAL